MIRSGQIDCDDLLIQSWPEFRGDDRDYSYEQVFFLLLSNQQS